jgi:hypothetical protein
LKWLENDDDQSCESNAEAKIASFPHMSSSCGAIKHVNKLTSTPHLLDAAVVTQPNHHLRGNMHILADYILTF